jgi:PAS domain S-box-containing protein
MTDLDMKIRYVNPAFTALTGFASREVMGRHIVSLLWEQMPKQDRENLENTLAQAKTWEGEAIGQCKDGRIYDAVVTVAPMHDAEGRVVGFVSSHRDISRLKQLDRARRQFITNVSHELRTPAANVKVYAHLLRIGKEPERADSYLEVLEDQANRLGQLVEDVLELTELDSGQAVTAWEPISLPAFIQDVVARHQNSARGADLTLAARPVPSSLPAVNGDPVRLAQALSELIENAVMFTPAGGQVSVETTTTKEGEQSWVKIAVHDTGLGISPDEQERVFDRFFRGRLAESGYVPGTGLGLNIVQQIVWAHGGKVTVDSDEGSGSTFTLWLPGVE